MEMGRGSGKVGWRGKTREDPGRSGKTHGAVRRVVGLGAGRDARFALHKGCWSGGRVGRKAGMVERGLPWARGRRPGEVGRGQGRVKKLLGRAYRDPKRPHPSAVPAVEPPTSQDVASESCPGSRLHMHEAQLIMQQRARLLVPAPDLLPALSGHGGSGQLRAAIYPPALSPAPSPASHTPSPRPAFHSAEAMSASSLGRGAHRQQGECHGNGHFPQKYSVWPPSCTEGCQGPE